jgi:hypothetical protein
MVVIPCPVSKRCDTHEPAGPVTEASLRYGVLASVRVLLGPTFLNADGAREKSRGALTAFYLWNVPNCVLGHVPEIRSYGYLRRN